MAATRLFENVWFYKGVSVAARPLVVAHHLAEILGCEAKAVRLGRDGQGKPVIERPSCDLVFSTAHRQDILLLAVARGTTVGCDLESEIEDEGVAQLDHALVRQFFSAAEADWYDGLPPSLKREAFRKLWTGKEAVLKARGIGLANGAREPDFSPFLISAEPVPDKLSGVILDGARYALEWGRFKAGDGGFLAAVARSERPLIS